jgi:UDP-glucose:(heptosyl)LPS alpha-1,3-glucosyltransferase
MKSTGRHLRIAFVVHDYSRNLGHGRYVAELASRFKRDHEVHVFANTFEEPEPSGITYHHVPAWRVSALASIMSFVLPATVMVRGRFDVIHAQGLCGLRHNVATAHFCQAGWYKALARANGSLTWRQWLLDALITPLERLALMKNSTRRVIAISERLRDDLEWHYGRRDGMRVVYHGVDLSTFHPRNRERYRDLVRSELAIAPAECLALYVGNLQKGAAAAIRATARTAGVRLMLVSSSNTAASRSIAQEERVTDRVSFHPFSKQIERFFAAADVFVFPTFFDAYGMVISEAMASGLPVITSRAAGAAELIDHGESGWLTTDPWSLDEIAGGLRALAADPGLRQRMGAAARSKIEEYTWDRTAEQTMAIYREISTCNHGAANLNTAVDPSHAEFNVLE